MQQTNMPDAFGAINQQGTLTIHRVLPGQIERVWAYLTDSDLRRRWLAAGDMQMQADAPFEFIWRNDELTHPPGVRPSGFGTEHRMQGRVVECDPPRRLVITWDNSGHVSFELTQKGDAVLLTLTHHRLPDRGMTLMVGAGWHMHLDILQARMAGTEPEPFWDGWVRLKGEYDRRVPVQS